MAMVGGCECADSLDTRRYCGLVQAQEAVLRLLASDPFVEEPVRLRPRRDALAID